MILKGTWDAARVRYSSFPYQLIRDAAELEFKRIQSFGSKSRAEQDREGGYGNTIGIIVADLPQGLAAIVHKGFVNYGSDQNYVAFHLPYFLSNSWVFDVKKLGESWFKARLSKNQGAAQALLQTIFCKLYKYCANFWCRECRELSERWHSSSLLQGTDGPQATVSDLPYF